MLLSMGEKDGLLLSANNELQIKSVQLCDDCQKRGSAKILLQKNLLSVPPDAKATAHGKMDEFFSTD